MQSRVFGFCPLTGLRARARFASPPTPFVCNYNVRLLLAATASGRIQPSSFVSCILNANGTCRWHIPIANYCLCPDLTLPSIIFMKNFPTCEILPFYTNTLYYWSHLPISSYAPVISYKPLYFLYRYSRNNRIASSGV
jgi:hypothetical protein